MEKEWETALEFRAERENAIMEDIDFSKAINNEAIDQMSEDRLMDIMRILEGAGY